MTNWQHRINIQKCLDEHEEETPEAVLEAAKAIQKEISDHHLTRIFTNLPHVLVEKTEKAVSAGFDYESVCDVFNGVLSSIYDRADYEKVWTSG